MRQEECLRCHGSGKLDCPQRCDKGRILRATSNDKCPNPKCHNGYETCPVCHGKGIVILRGRG